MMMKNSDASCAWQHQCMTHRCSICHESNHSFWVWPTGADRKWVTTVTDVMMLNYAVGLDVARDGTQCNTQGVWPCKLLIDSLPLQLLATSHLSLDLTKAWRKQPRRNFPQTVVAWWPTITNHHWWVWKRKKIHMNIINLKWTNYHTWRAFQASCVSK